MKTCQFGKFWTLDTDEKARDTFYFLIMIYSDIANNIRKYRSLAGMTQEQLAEKTKLTPNQISRIETGARRTSVEALVAIGAALDVSLDALAAPSTCLKLQQFQLDFLLTINMAIFRFFNENEKLFSSSTNSRNYGAN